MHIIKAKSKIQIPFTQREAEEKFDHLVAKLDNSWIGDQAMLRKQLDLITQILQLGAYSLPKKVLECEKVDRFFNDAIRKDLFRCFGDIRKGDVFIVEFLCKVKCVQIFINN